MLRKRSAAGWIAAAALLLLLAVLYGSQIHLRDRGNRVPQAAPHALQERRLKEAAVKRDRETTAALLADACGLELSRFLDGERRSRATADGTGARLDGLMRSRPHLQAVVLSGASGRIVRGSVPPGAQEKLAAAVAAAESRRPYRSPEFVSGGKHYVALGVPDRGRPGGAAALVRQDLIEEVERGQQRNMRLTPYPGEGRFRTESAEAGSLKDTTVRSGEDNQRVSHYHVDEVVVRFRSTPDRRTLDGISRDIGAVSVRKLGYTYVFRSNRLDARAMMTYFQRKWKPYYAEPHYLYLTNEADSGQLPPIVPNDILYSRYQWNLPSIEAERGWNVSRGSEGVVVAVVDTGVQRDHPDLRGKLVEGLNIIDRTSPPEDDVGHGTHVAGIVAANVNNGEGVAGLSWYNRIMPIKALDDTGAGSTYSVAEGIIWATDHGAKVINLSLGNYASAQFLHDAIRYAYDRDVVLVAASGNDNTDRPGYPAAYPEVFAVGATNYESNRASFSNYGSYVDAAAPGETIPSTYTGSQYAALSGTSMASPHVAALAALIRSANPELSNRDVMAIMKRTARDLGAKGPDDQFGSGQVDAARALGAAQQETMSLQSFPDRVARRLDLIRKQFEDKLGLP